MADSISIETSAKTEVISGAGLTVFDNNPVAPLGVIAMPGCEQFAEAVNWYLGEWRKNAESQGKSYTVPGYDAKSFVLPIKCSRFGTGEGKGLVLSTVRGYDLYIISDVTARNVTYKMYDQNVPCSPDDHYANLKRIIAAVAGRAHRITVIMPFLYESRQHRRVSRESMDCALMLQELTGMGVSNIITFDAHDPRIVNAIPLNGFESVMPSYQVLKALFRKEKDLRVDKEHMMIVSPDEGAMARNIFYATELKLDLGMFYKRRDYSKVVDGRNPIVAHEYLGASVRGKDVLVADDIISSGESMIQLIDDLKRRRAKRVFLTATFCFFTNGTKAFDAAYKKGFLGGVLGTNLCYVPDEIRNKPWYIEVDMRKYVALIIASLNHDHSLDPLINPHARVENLIKKYQAEQASAAEADK